MKKKIKDFKAQAAEDAPEGAAITPVFDNVLFDHMRLITEAIAADSAENEIVAARDLLRGSFLPNCKFLLRDGAHATRRVLSRCWRADPVLNSILGVFCHDPSSPSQLIQHSLEFRHMYADCCEQNLDEAAVSTIFHNMRAAKHRIETYVRPLSRCLLNLTGLMAFCSKVSYVRKGTAAATACIAFLSVLTVEVLLLAAMMADAGTELMLLIRVLDTEAVVTAALAQCIHDFLNRIAWLFFDGGVFVVEGHIRFIVDWLATRHFFLVKGSGCSLGGTPPTQEQTELGLETMKAWTKLAEKTLEA